MGTTRPLVEMMFGFGKHDHSRDEERDHLRHFLIVSFGVALLAMIAFGFGTGQVRIEGAFAAAEIWELFKFLMIGLFGYVLAKIERVRNGQATPDKAATPSP